MTMLRIFLLLVPASATSNLAAQQMLYYNGRIHTADSTRPLVHYFVVEKGEIKAIGDTLSPAALGQYAARTDLRGKTVIPGLIDSHLHFIDGGLGMLQLDFADVTTPSLLARKIAATRHQLTDGLYVGRGLGYEALAGVESPLDLLDRLLPGIPALIFLKSGHAAIANSAAMRRFGFTTAKKFADVELPTNRQGGLSGYLLEGAAMEANRVITSLYAPETIERAILTAQRRALSYGITTVGDNTFHPYFYKIYQQLQKHGALKIRIRARSYGRIPQTADLMRGLGKKRLGLIGGGVDFARVRHHATKEFVDGSLSVPRNGASGPEPGGLVFLSREQLKSLFLLHPTTTYAFHVQGKAGLQNILDAYRAVQTRVEPHRHVIDHAGYASAPQMREARRLGLAVTILGGQIFDYERLSVDYRQRTRHGKPFDETNLLDARTKYREAKGALTSDFPYGMDTLFAAYPRIDGLNPFPIMAVAATARYPDGSEITGMEHKVLTATEALRAYTTHGAYVLGEEDKLGKIAVGHRADFAILTNDPFIGEPMRLYDAEVAETHIAGERVFVRNEFSRTDTTSNVNIRVNATDYAVSPIIGYDPTVGLILGGAYFNYPLKTPGRYFDLQVQSLLSGKVNLQASYASFEIFRNATFTVSGSYSNFFQYYFGEGNQTRADGYRKVYADVATLKPELRLALPRRFTLNAYADARGRHETKVTDAGHTRLDARLFPREYAIGLGADIRRDTRDNASSSHTGTLVLVSGLYIPAALAERGRGNAAQFGVDIRHFRYLYNANFVLALRLAGGYSLGNPGYLYRYSLGGAYALRGYYANRFRGEKYYLGQAEMRFPLYRRFSGAAFAEAGDVTDGHFAAAAKSTYGAGLRFALNENIRLRLDYGRSRDQNGLFFTFGQAF